MLRAVNGELASLLSTATREDLGRPTPHAGWDLGDLCLHLLAQNVALAGVVSGGAIPRADRVATLTRSALEASLERDGGGLDVRYRRTARLLEDAFAAVEDPTRRCTTDGHGDELDVATLYAMHVSMAVIDCCDVAHALGRSYEPTSDLARRAVRIVRSPLAVG